MHLFNSHQQPSLAPCPRFSIKHRHLDRILKAQSVVLFSAENMKLLTFTTLFAAPGALAQPTPRADGSAFGIMTLRSASPIHFGRVTASEGGLFVNGHIPDATCDGEVPRQSYFSLENGQLYLYGGDKFPRQLVYVDRSPAGKSIFPSAHCARRSRILIFLRPRKNRLRFRRPETSWEHGGQGLEDDAVGPV